MRDLPKTPVHSSLVRPILIAGIERKLMIPLVGVILLLLLAFRLNPVTPTLAVLLVVVVFPRLRVLAKRDPQGFAVFLRHLATAGLYPGQARLGQPRRRPSTF